MARSPTSLLELRRVVSRCAYARWSSRGSSSAASRSSALTAFGLVPSRQARKACATTASTGDGVRRGVSGLGGSGITRRSSGRWSGCARLGDAVGWSGRGRSRSVKAGTWVLAGREEGYRLPFGTGAGDGERVTLARGAEEEGDSAAGLGRLSHGGSAVAATRLRMRRGPGSIPMRDRRYMTFRYPCPDSQTPYFIGVLVAWTCCGRGMFSGCQGRTGQLRMFPARLWPEGTPGRSFTLRDAGVSLPSRSARRGWTGEGDRW